MLFRRGNFWLKYFAKKFSLSGLASSTFGTLFRDAGGRKKGRGESEKEKSVKHMIASADGRGVT
jgi:hypothetical protein